MKLEIAAAPQSSISEQAGPGLAIFELEINQDGAISKSTLVSGDPSTVNPARRIFEGWRFVGVTSGPVHVTAILLSKEEPNAVDSVKAVNGHVPDLYAWRHRAPYPLRVIEPVYPIGGCDKGTVVLQLELTPAGMVQHVHTIAGYANLTPAAVAAVGNWTFFIPYKHAIPQIAIAVIEFQAERYPESALWPASLSWSE